LQCWRAGLREDKGINPEKLTEATAQG
jgi:hypothetical protein